MKAKSRHAIKDRLANETHGSALVLAHYRRTGIVQGWTVAQAEKLCKELGLTIFELGRLCAVFETPTPAGTIPSHALVARAIRQDHFSPCASLNFSILADHFAAKRAMRSGGQMPEYPMPISAFNPPERPHHD